MNPILQLPPTAASDILNYVSRLFTDLSPIILLIIGVFLAVSVLGVLLRLFTK